MNNAIVILSMAVYILVSILLIIFLMKLLHSIYCKILWKSSEAYGELENIKVYVKNNIHSPLYEQIWLDKLDKFRSFNYEKYILDKASSNKQWADDTVRTIQYNTNILNESYQKAERLRNIESENKDLEKIQNKNINNFLNTLDTNYDKEKHLNIEWRYTSPAGRNRYTASVKVSLNEMNSLINKSKELEKERNTHEYFVKQERKKVTPKIRYQVLRRDNYTCQYCGRAVSDGVKLHVDHIKPVSKGGKTELSNLVTACQDCNLGKSDSYDESRSIKII